MSTSAARFACLSLRRSDQPARPAGMGMCISNKVPKVNAAGFIHRLEERDEEIESLKHQLTTSRERARKLRLENSVLQEDLFFSKHNTVAVAKFMQKLNQRRVECMCEACINTGRWKGDHPMDKLYECKFCPFWEDLLDKYRLSYQYKPHHLGEVGGVQQGVYGIMLPLPCAIVNTGEDVFWRCPAFGNLIAVSPPGLDRLDTPPRKRLAALMRYLADSRVRDLAADSDEDPPEEYSDSSDEEPADLSDLAGAAGRVAPA